MVFSLYDASVQTFQQILGSVSGLLDKAEAWCLQQGIAPEELIGTRLALDPPVQLSGEIDGSAFDWGYRWLPQGHLLAGQH